MSEKPVILINVFTVEPAKQQELIDLLTRATEDSVRHAAGFLSARLHRSLDGTKVTMYAQWRSVQDYEAMRKDPIVEAPGDLVLVGRVMGLLSGVGKQLGSEVNLFATLMPYLVAQNETPDSVTL